MAANTNARFYRLNRLPDFAADGNHVGLFVYVPEHIMESNDTAWVKGYETLTVNGNDYTLSNPITVSYITPTGNPDFEQAKIEGGLWFGGQKGWELLTNIGDGLGWDEIYYWFDHYVAGEAEIFNAAPLTGTGETGTEITIFDPVLDRTNGLHASTVGSDEHKFTVGDGALKISGKGATDNSGSTPVLPAATTEDVHSANDVLDSTLTLDDSLIWTPSGSAAPCTIGVRTKTTVTAENPVVTLQDIAGLSGAMHLIGTLDSVGEWPDKDTSIWYTGAAPSPTSQTQTIQIHEGDTFIVTTAHPGPDNIAYEVGDTVFYYESGGSLVYKVVNQNITTGTQDGQHAAVDMPGGSLEAGKLVIATQSGIATTPAEISDFVTDVTSTQEINDTAQTTEDEGQTHETTYTVTTIVDRVDDGSDSNITTDSHDIIFHSNNNSLTIQEDTTNAEHQINFDLVWLTTMV